MGNPGAVRARRRSSWGIQARFSLGAYAGREDEAATSVASDAATGVVRRYYGALAAGDGNTSAELCRYPLIDVGVGEVQRI